MDKNTEDILAALAFIKERLVTKDDVRDIIKEEVPPIVRAMIVEVVPGIVALEIKPVREQLKQIEKRLDTIEEHYANLKGVTKEIDEIRAEVREIQKHLASRRRSRRDHPRARRADFVHFTRFVRSGLRLLPHRCRLGGCLELS
jgi:uncharacterized membrane protein YccC